MAKGRDSAWLVWVTTPDLRTARRLAQLALAQRLAAGVQIRPELESHYRWLGKLEQSREVLVTFKTVTTHLKALERLVGAEHAYETPQFVAVRIGAGSVKFLRWIRDST